jgi:hypothetical protein
LTICDSCCTGRLTKSSKPDARMHYPSKLTAILKSSCTVCNTFLDKWNAVVTLPHINTSNLNPPGVAIPAIMLSQPAPVCGGDGPSVRFDSPLLRRPSPSLPRTMHVAAALTACGYSGAFWRDGYDTASSFKYPSVDLSRAVDLFSCLASLLSARASANLLGAKCREHSLE